MLSVKIDDHLKLARNRRFKLEHKDKINCNNQQSSISRLTYNRSKFSSRFYISFAITLTLIFTQLFLIHYFIGFNSRLFTLYDPNDVSASQDWDCIWPGLGEVHELAERFGVDLVIVDPDLLKVLERTSSHDNGEGAITFSGPAKRYQEPTDKTIVHLAAINETSGGQPNLKLFYNALKNNGYTILTYHDTSQLMQPEVYRRPSHLFDDMPLDGVRWHKYPHDSAHMQDDSMKTHSDWLQEVPHDDEVSKIYTEFISHIFILNTSQAINMSNERIQKCNFNNKLKHFVVTHILILYNYDHNPSSQWIQSSLSMNEIDKHKLLSYGVHSFDFKIPLEETYIHDKRNIVSVSRPVVRDGRRKRSSQDRVRVFEPEEDRLLRFANNSYIFCKRQQFNISGLIDSSRRVSNYLLELDNTRPVSVYEDGELIQDQLSIALQFMDTYSRAYKNFSYWITGASLLGYHKHCDLAVVPEIHFANKLKLSDQQLDTKVYSADNILINLEIGLFSSEVNESVLEDLATARGIGVTMMSDWRKTNSPISFQFQDCPNILFKLYAYDLRKDFYQNYFVTNSTMTMTHKSNKRQRFDSSKNLSYGHHVFNTNNLHLCWTHVNRLNPFRIPCNVHDHLRRIYVI